MDYEVVVQGTTPLIMNNGEAGIDKRSDISRQIAAINAKKGTNRTVADEDLRDRLEAERAVYWIGDTATPTLPPGMFRACIENAARTLKQGPLVRQGLLVREVASFNYDRNKVSAQGEVTRRDIAEAFMYTVGVKQGTSRIPRVRAKFDTWDATFVADIDETIIDGPDALDAWLKIGGRRIGVGDWRPATSGIHGQFSVKSITKMSV